MKDPLRGIVLFVAIFLMVYAAAHLYIWWRLVKPLALHGTWLVAVRIAIGVLFVSFPLIHFGFRHDSGSLVGAMNWFSSVWMGMVVYFVVVTLACDVIHLVLFRRPFSGPMASGTITAVVVLITGYGLIEARQIGVTTLHVRMPNLSSELRLVQISDVHLGRIVRGARLSAIVQKVNSLQPDLIVITGDLVDAEALHMEEMIPLLRELKARHGVYAVTGNHEFFAGVGRVEAFLKQAGVTCLRNRSVTVAGNLQLIGLDDPMAWRFTGTTPPPLSQLVECGKPTVLLLHTPVTTLEQLSAAGVHLQLSGHTHKGQLWPLHAVVKLIYKQTPYGLLSNGKSTIYVSRGVGTWGPPMRVGAPPEITLVMLTP